MGLAAEHRGPAHVRLTIAVPDTGDILPVKALSPLVSLNSIAAAAMFRASGNPAPI